MRSLVQKIDQTFHQHQWLSAGDLILVCVSGGSDSVALFHLLRELQPKWRYQFHVLHFNHGLREESLQEQRFVESLAEKYQIPCHVQAADHLAKRNTAIQEHARQWRQEQSLRLLRDLHGRYVITAHHADDQMETVLLKWLRGCHLSNLRGMAWKNGQTLRPLLNCAKAELQDYLTAEQFQWMEDASNQCPKYLRNRVRHELIPLMNELARGSLSQRIEDMVEQSAGVNEWISRAMEPFDTAIQENQEPLLLDRLFREPEFLRYSILCEFIVRHTQRSIGYQQLRRIEKHLKQSAQRWIFPLSPRFQLERKGNHLWIKPL